ncbi:BZ3500_MvSof-1268-A1-R1_Chr1-3g01872 [Microbotryum saponariae]|uniref:BZ3500_MvSof-1268-A1-R1_Chr1-3g01872 protein n=1 Tax=Microbotryum saponariae TaxID=289078 RepID=A0A2X0KSX1_9BASI|nr:BZ3500_MvSof-1268-A1-R1_Chr1-3g01872 [Microbotryum saponariae]SCZ94786.1 BZ3501_MvSof-1269-A2-R1_Chr1-3g01474 [Microbotryum saponariae]
MIRIPLAPLRLTDYTRLTSPLSPHKRKSGRSSGSGSTASSRTSRSSVSSVATPSGDASSEASASTRTSTSTRGTRLSSTMASSLLPSPFGTTTTTTPPLARSSSEAGRPLKTLYEAPRPSSSSSARAMAHEDEQGDDDDDDSPDELVAQTNRAATTPPRRLMDLFLSSAAKEREASVSAGRAHSPRSPQPRSRTRSEPVHLSPSRNAARASATPAPAPTSKDEEMAAAPTWSFYEDPVEPAPVASTTANGANDSTLDTEADEVEYHDENTKPSPTSLARLLRHRSLAPVEAPRLMPSPTSMTIPSAPVPQTQVAPPLTPPPTTLEWNEMHTITAIAIPGSPPSIFPTWDPIEDSTRRQSFFGDTGNHSFDSRISSSHGCDEIGRKRSGLGEEELLEEAHEGKRMRLSSE